jgi:Ca2+-binding RTX toxin-like protein
VGKATGEGLDSISGFQVVVGSEFDDSLTGDGGDNAFQPFLGNDDVDGGGGNDLAILASAENGVVANLATGSATGEGTDTLAAIENLWGSAGADNLTGDGNSNSIFGLTGSDQIAGAAGDDQLDGGGGVDSLDGGDGNDRCSAGETVTNCETSASAGSLGLTGFLWQPASSPLLRLMATFAIP